MGLLAGYFMLRGDISQHLRLFLTTGILGGYTTFSAFSLDAILLWERQQYGMAALYVFISVIASFAGLMIGLSRPPANGRWNGLFAWDEGCGGKHAGEIEAHG